MIIEGLCSFVLNIIEMVFAGLNLISFPVSAIDVVVDFMRLSNWVLGASYASLAITSITGWWSFKALYGLILWIYEKIPLT